MCWTHANRILSLLVVLLHENHWNHMLPIFFILSSTWWWNLSVLIWPTWKYFRWVLFGAIPEEFRIYLKKLNKHQLLFCAEQLSVQSLCVSIFQRKGIKATYYVFLFSSCNAFMAGDCHSIKMFLVSHGHRFLWKRNKIHHFDTFELYRFGRQHWLPLLSVNGQLFLTFFVVWLNIFKTFVGSKQLTSVILLMFKLSEDNVHIPQNIPIWAPIIFILINGISPLFEACFLR